MLNSNTPGALLSRTSRRSGAKEALEKACHLAAGRQYTQAAQYFEKATALKAGFDALCGKALCMYKTGRLNEALDAAGQAAAAEPSRPEPHFVIGLAQKDAGQYSQAAQSFERAMRMGYERAAALYQRGAANFLAGRLEPAGADFEEVARLRPASAAAFYNLGVVHIHRSSWKEAARCLSRCVRLDPSSAEHYHEMIFRIGQAQAGEEFHFRGHRIKNMLALLADTYCRSLKSVEDSEDEVAGRLARTLAEMSELLSCVRRDPLELDLWDVHDIIEMALLRAAEALATVEVQKVFGADVPGLICDAESLNEAFLNIILNAAEAMGQGGTLTVRTRWDGGSSVRVEFEDTGGGIRAEPLEKVFQFAFTTRAGGTGLGLCQAKRAVEEHRGAISARNVARGAILVVELPLAAAAAERIQETGLRPDLSDDISLFFEGESDVRIETSAGS